MSYVAHLSPHVSSPSTSACDALLLGDQMMHIIGDSASRRLRSRVVRAVLRIAGPPSVIPEEILLQDMHPVISLSRLVVHWFQIQGDH